MTHRWILALLVTVIACMIFLAGCTAPSQTNASVVQGSSTVQTTNATTVATSLPTTVTTVPVTTTTSPTPSPTPIKTPSNNLLTAEEAQRSVEDMLKTRSAVQEMGLGIQGREEDYKIRMPNGVAVPDNAEVGKAVLITQDGEKVYEVPVLSDGRRIGEFYVNQKQTVITR